MKKKNKLINKHIEKLKIKKLEGQTKKQTYR